MTWHLDWPTRPRVLVPAPLHTGGRDSSRAGEGTAAGRVSTKGFMQGQLHMRAVTASRARCTLAVPLQCTHHLMQAMTGLGWKGEPPPRE